MQLYIVIPNPYPILRCHHCVRCKVVISMQIAPLEKDPSTRVLYQQGDFVFPVLKKVLLVSILQNQKT